MKTFRCGYHPDDPVEFAYGEMDPARAAQFQVHLTECTACRREVEELARAAFLCRQVRECTVEQASWTRTPAFERAVPSRQGFLRPAVWIPAVAGATLLLITLLLWPRTEPIQSGNQTNLAKAPEPVVTETYPLRVLRVSGQVNRLDSVEAVQQPLRLDAVVSDGETIVTGEKSQVELQTHDESQIRLGESSRLRVLHSGSDSDAFRLDQGGVACRVETRQNSGNFSVDVGNHRASVLGTLFGVKRYDDGGAEIGVGEGSVEVKRMDCPEPAVPVLAGHQLVLRPNGGSTISALGKEMRELMLPSPIRDDRPGNGKSEAGRPAAIKTPQPAVEKKEPLRPLPETTPVRPRADPVPEPTGSQGIEALVEEIYQDTGWIFDSLRQEMQRGNFDLVVEKLDAYLADPESPNRSEAVFLEAVCLEILKRWREARALYLQYLHDWPQGRWAEEVRIGLLRTGGW